MKTLLLTPNDILFFRDGRPMEGSLAGHSAAWCPPHIISHALHAALRRSGLSSHQHHTGVSGKRDYSGERNQVFGSLLTAGPFPVDKGGNWYFPVPADLLKYETDEVNEKGERTGKKIIKAKIGFLPHLSKNPSSLPKPLTCALGSVLPPSKDGKPGNWLRADAYEAYLRNDGALSPSDFKTDSDIGDFEASIGIGIDPKRQTQDGKRIYSAQYLRLKEDWKLGVSVSADDKEEGDLIGKLFITEHHIIVGGQQRVCTANVVSSDIPFPQSIVPNGNRVKWVLLSPAVFPEIGEHRGGWLPSWIDAQSGKVLLKQNVVRGEREPRADWRTRVQAAGSIDAKLVAAKIGSATPVSGWDLEYGAKPTQLAVPAGSIYYFECGDNEAAKQLAAVLNYPNRRSTLWGEKGYGIGICSTWDEFANNKN